MFLPSKRARTHTHTHTRPPHPSPILFEAIEREFIRGVHNVYEYTRVYLDLRNRFNLVSSRERSFNFYRCTVFFFFLSVRTSAIWTRNCYFFPLSPPLTLLVSPVNYFPSLERRNYVSPPFARATCNTSSREFSIRLTIMFTRVTMDNSYAGI